MPRDHAPLTFWSGHGGTGRARGRLAGGISAWIVVNDSHGAVIQTTGKGGASFNSLVKRP